MNRWMMKKQLNVTTIKLAMQIIKSNTTIEMLMQIMTPDKNGITEIQLDWKDVYGELRKGTYRIVKDKDFTTLYSESFEINE